MRCIIQQVTKASVHMPELDQKESISKGVLVYLGIHKDDKLEQASKIEYFTKKIQTVKILSGEDGKINKSLGESDGNILLISNFTLYGRNKKGSSVDYTHSAPYQEAETIFNTLVQKLKTTGLRIRTGVFGAKMVVESSVLGPINCIWEF